MLRQQTIDRYGRTVALVAVDGKDVGGEMLSQGFAWIYDRYFAEATTDIQEVYQKDQDQAKAGKLGLWSDPNSIPPWVFRQLAKGRSRAEISFWLDRSAPKVRWFSFGNRSNRTASGRGDSRGSGPGLGQYQERKILESWLPVLWQNEKGRIHV